MSRITNSMLTNNYLNDMQRNLKNLGTIQNQMSSGQTIRRGSEDPSGAARLMQLNADIAANKQYNTNISDTSNWLDTTDTALSQAGNVLSRVRELMVKAGNGTYKEEDIKTIKDEVTEDVKQLVQNLNTSFNGSYIFGGTKSTTKPLVADDNGNISYADKDGNAVSDDASGNITVTLAKKNQISNNPPSTDAIKSITKDSGGTVVIAYTSGGPSTTATSANLDTALTAAGYPSPAAGIQVNSLLTQADITITQIGSKLSAEISQGVTVEYNKTAVDMLKFTDKTLGPIDAKAVISQIVGNLSIASDPAQSSANQKTALSDINGTNLKQLDSIISNILQNRSSLGTMQNRMDSAKTTNEDQNYNMTSILTSTGDIDLTEKTVEYSTVQTVYTAALQTSSKVLKSTILDYI